MSLLEDLATARDGRPATCAVRALLASLNADEANAIRAALAGTLRGSTLGRVLRANGHDISDGSLQRHRRGACQCPTS